MSLQLVKRLIPLHNAVYKTVTDDGVILGHGYIDAGWLNRTHRHSERVNQWAYIEHLPKKYVDKRIDKNRKMMDNAAKFFKNMNDVLDKFAKLPKSHFIDPGPGIMEASEEAEITMEELEALMAEPQIQEYIKYVTLANDEGPAEEGFGFTASQNDFDIHQILAIVGIALELLRQTFNLLGSVQGELVRNVANDDGSLTLVIADYYHGTAKTIRHVGMFGIINNVNYVRNEGNKIRRMKGRPPGGFNLKGGRKIYVGL
ncbi:MAG: hypothetical protein AAFQ94_02500 [Bacteroidota bacterium]